MKPINLWGSGLSASSLAASSENRVNCIYEIKKDEGRVIIRGTPGSVASVALPASPIRGKWVVNNILYVVAAAGLYSVTPAGVVTYLGAIGSSSGRVGMADNAVQLIVVDGSAGYILTLATSALTTITDVNFPNGATTVAFLNGSFVCEKPNTRTYYVSALLDGTSWTVFGASVFGTKEQYSDSLIAVDAFMSILILWGSASMELWQNVGSSPNPFALIPGAAYKYGLYAKYSRAQVDNAVYFLGVTPQGSLCVFSTNGTVPQRVSSDDVEDLLNSLSSNGTTMTDAVALAYSIIGHDIYQLTFPSANLSLIYDTGTGLWSRVQTGVAVGRHFADTAVTFNSQTVFSDSSTGVLYTLSPSAYTDAGTVIKRQVTSKHIRYGGDEFAITELMLLTDSGVVPQSSDYKMSLEVSRDYGHTYGSPRPRTLGKIGQYKTPRLKWDMLGSAEDFVLRFTLTDPVPFVIADTLIETSINE